MIKVDDYNYHGDTSILNSKNFLGIVGSRLILPYTINNLEDLFSKIKDLDLTIVSGGMYGVDIYCHNLALKYGMNTVVFLPQGLKNYFNSSLFLKLKIKDDSKILFLSKYEDYERPRKYTFLERNKDVVDLSEVMLVAQAGNNSGSIFSGKYAIQKNKLIYSVPFSLENPQFQGTNTLISLGSRIYLNPESLISNYKFKTDNSSKILDLIKIKGYVDDKDIDDLDNVLVKKNLLKLILKGEIFYSEGKYFKC